MPERAGTDFDSNVGRGYPLKHTVAGRHLLPLNILLPTSHYDLDFCSRVRLRTGVSIFCNLVRRKALAEVGHEGMSREIWPRLYNPL